MAEIINSIESEKHLHISGYIYSKHSENHGRVYWNCRWKGEFFARAITSNSVDGINVHKEPNKSEHNYAPNLEEVNALRIVVDLKKKVSKHLEASPAQVL